MATRIHILSRTAKAEVLARRELGSFGITLEVEENYPGQIDPALRRFGIDSDNAALLSSPNLILASPTPTELAEFICWVKTHPTVILEEETRPAPTPPATLALTAEPASPATPATPATPAMPATPASSVTSGEDESATSGGDSVKPQTRMDLARQIREAAAAKIEKRNKRQRPYQKQKQGDYTREYSS